MTNREKYKDLLNDISTDERMMINLLAVNKETGRPCYCRDLICPECAFSDNLNTDCFDSAIAWLGKDVPYESGDIKRDT